MSAFAAIPFTWTTCIYENCGVSFASPVLAERKKDGRSFFCPNGHSQYYVITETEEQKLRKQLSAKECELQSALKDASWQRSQRQTAERTAKIAKTKLRRTRERIQAGICPDCKRHFVNLQAHMECKHAHKQERIKAHARQRQQRTK